MDKRTIQTKRKIKEACAFILAEKEFNDITVTDIANRAGINRKTFYSYYRGIIDVINEVEDDFLNAFEDALETISLSEFINDPAILYWKCSDVINGEGEDLFLKYVLANRNDELVNKLEKKLIDIVKNKTVAAVDLNPGDIGLITHFVIAGEIAAYKYWLNHKDEYPVARISQIISAFLKRGVCGMFDENNSENNKENA